MISTGDRQLRTCWTDARCYTCQIDWMVGFISIEWRPLYSGLARRVPEAHNLYPGDGPTRFQLGQIRLLLLGGNFVVPFNLCRRYVGIIP